MDSDEVGKTVLRPRQPGESIKVAETVLKRRDRNIKAAAERAEKIKKQRDKRARKAKGKLGIIRAESMVKKWRVQNSDERRIKSDRKKPVGKVFEKINCLAVVRNARDGGSKQVKTMLKNLRLKETNTLVFLPNSQESLQKLKVIKPFAFWGCPSYSSVLQLMQRKAYFKEPKSSERKPLSNNNLVEEHLGDVGMLCVEDLAHAIHTGSENMSSITARLWPFEFADARKAGKLAPDIEHPYGNIKYKINKRINELLG
jgi:large subunit ribosomal protein L7e